MAIIRLNGFSGENRAIHPALLASNIGTTSLNQKPGRGDLRPWKSPLTVAAVPSGRKTIYRMGRDVPSDVNYWLSWTTDVHVARGPNQSDSAERTYFTGSGTPKWTDTTKALASAPYPTTARELGVPAPLSGPALAAAGGVSTTDELRYYVYTYVTDVGEESAPSPASAGLTCKTDAIVTVSGFSAVPGGNYGINRMRIYRTQTGQSGGAEFFFLKEVASSTTTTDDTNTALGEVLPSTTWLVPDPSMKWLTGMWNGMMAGIVGRAVRFCEAFVPYAWPLAYEILPVNSTPVAMATFGQNLVVVTDAEPHVITGGSPDALDDAPVNFIQACIAPLSTVSVGSGVVWASPDGLAFIGPSGPMMLTEGVMTREDWQAINPSSIIGCAYERRYFGFYTQSSVRKAFMLDPANPTGVYFMDFGVDAVYVDDQQDALYVLDGINIKKWDSGPALTTTFKSKVYQFPRPLTAFAVLQVNADAFPVTVSVDAIELDAAYVTATVAANVLLSAPSATTIRYTATVTGVAPAWLPSGYIADKYQIQVSSTGAVQSITLAHSIQELDQV